LPVPARKRVGLANARLPLVGQGFILAGNLLTPCLTLVRPGWVLTVRFIELLSHYWWSAVFPDLLACELVFKLFLPVTVLNGEWGALHIVRRSFGSVIYQENISLCVICSWHLYLLLYHAVKICRRRIHYPDFV